MKKVVAILSFCVMTSPLACSDAASGSMHKKHHKKTRHHHVKCVNKADPSLVAATTKDAAPALEEKKYPWMDNLSGTIALTSNYVFRGISQTENLPAVQGGFTYTLPVNIYASVWGSNVKFSGTPDAYLELDTILGYRNTVGDDFSYDLNAARYNYPRARSLNYNELNSLFNYKFLQAGISYSGNAYNSHRGGTYYVGGVKYAIPAQYVLGFEDVTFLALFGHYSLSRAAGNSNNDYNVALSKKLRNYTVMAQWTSTNGRQHNSPYDGSMLIGTVSAEF